MRNILREPLLHFLLLGLMAFAAARYFDSESERHRIDAGPQRRARLAAMYLQQYGVKPTREQAQQLLDQYVRNEILYREGLAMGLEQDDEIVRRRVIQKIEFVNEDLDVGAAPDRARLAEFFARHRDRYDLPASASFTQIFFSADRGGEAAAKARADAVLHGVSSGDAPSSPPPTLGDNFADGARFPALSSDGARSVFGDSPLSAALFTAPIGAWSGPFRSAYGWHLVRIEARQAAQPVELESVKERVQADYASELREQRNRLEFRKLASKYEIVTDGPSA
jgi:hypothetical protein